jgi:hypothetical protein
MLFRWSQPCRAGRANEITQISCTGRSSQSKTGEDPRPIVETKSRRLGDGSSPRLLATRRHGACGDNSPGELGADAVNHARAEIFLDAFRRRRR